MPTPHPGATLPKAGLGNVIGGERSQRLQSSLSWLMAAPAAAQAGPGPNILGTWKFDLRQGNKEGPRTVIVRNDSSASYGEETVRWRLKGDSLMLALGGEWTTYHLRVRGKRMTLSGGDLIDPITFERVGPPSPRPATVKVPPDPDGP